MKKQSPWGVLILIIVIVLGLTMCFMQFSDWRAMKDSLQQEEQLLATSELRLASVKVMEKNKGQLEADMEVLSQLLPESAQEAQLLLDLQSGADLSEMEFAQIRFNERVDQLGYWEMPLIMQFRGNYHQILYFLDYLQVYERAFRISELRIDENSEKDTMNVQIAASTFYVKE